MPSADVLMLCFGEGGHHAQARRLYARLKESTETMPGEVVSLTDKAGIALPGTPEFVFTALREKHYGGLRAVGHLVYALLRNLRQAFRIFQLGGCARRLLLVSVGPAFAVLPAVIVRLIGGQVVHVETWSRFTTYSVTGRLMYRIADHFLVQNEELLALYPRATYCGRL